MRVEETAQGYRWVCMSCARRGRPIQDRQTAKSRGGKHLLDQHRRKGRRLAHPISDEQIQAVQQQGV